MSGGLFKGQFAKTGPHTTGVGTQQSLTLLNILAQIDADDAESDLLLSCAPTAACCAWIAELLSDFELDGALGEVPAAVDNDAEGDYLGIAIFDTVVGDGTFLGPSPVLAMYRMR